MRKNWTKSDEMQLSICSWVWVISWFLAVWCPVFKTELFITGTFCLIMGLLGTSYRDKVEKEEEDAKSPSKS